MKLDVSTEYGYDVAAALRGPDDTSTVASHWKRMVTAVLRHFAGVGRESLRGVTVSSPSEAKHRWADFTRIQQREAKFWADRDGHAMSHSRIGFEAIENLLREPRKQQCKVYRKWLFKVGLLIR